MNISRYTDVESLTLKLQFITPAFLGGADGNAELRSASFNCKYLGAVHES